MQQLLQNSWTESSRTSVWMVCSVVRSSPGRHRANRIANKHEHLDKGKPQRPRVKPFHQRDVTIEVVQVQSGVSRQCVVVITSKRLSKWYASGSETWKNHGTPSPTNCSVVGAVSTNHASNSRGARD